MYKYKGESGLIAPIILILSSAKVIHLEIIKIINDHLKLSGWPGPVLGKSHRTIIWLQNCIKLLGRNQLQGS